VYGKFIRQVRQAHGLTQRELAQTTGISQSNISAYENGRRIPTVDTVNKLVVGSGFLLIAQSGKNVITCDLPLAGWFPDEDGMNDERDESLESGPPLRHDAPVGERVARIERVLAHADRARSMR
jgi:transcriptional regulator with XRE-family HTH domain